jgi:uncharacterized protein (DUF302 family)
MNGLITLDSPFNFAATLARLMAAVMEKGLTIFAVVEHADGAEVAGLSLRPTTVVIFGNAKGGTPLMQAAQTTGIDLPLKVLVWQDEGGAVHLGYNDPAWIAQRHGVEENLPVIASLAAALKAVAAAALTSS